MRVLIYPADSHGCGRYRMQWPGEYLAAEGHDVRVVPPADRALSLQIHNNMLVDVISEQVDGADVVVFQRLTHLWMAQAVSAIRDKGIAVVVDVDDDLNSIHPDNPAWWMMHPRHFGKTQHNGKTHQISWKFLMKACQDATMVTVSTPSLLSIYASHGRGAVLPNYLPDHAYVDGWDPDSELLGWPASLHSHPNDPAACGNAVSRLISEGVRFTHFGDPKATPAAFGISRPLSNDPEDKVRQWSVKDTILEPGAAGVTDIMDWPKAISQLGVAVCPLADTKFNVSKSHLKPLELSAAGVPWVASPRAEYLKLHALGCGVMAEKPKDWYKALKLLLNNPARRQERSEAGRKVANDMRLRDHCWKWAEVYEDALKIQRG